MSALRGGPLRAPVVAILIFEVCVLFLRSTLQTHLADSGYDRQRAADVSYLLVAPAFVVLFGPVVHRHKHFLATQLDVRKLSTKIVGTAVLAGLLLRTARWGLLVGMVSLGFYRDDDPAVIEGPLLGFECPPPASMFVFLLAMVCLVPIIEETINRGFLLYTLIERGKAFAVVASSFLFAVFHPPVAMFSAFLTGLYFGVLALRSGSLLPGIVAHGTYNALVLPDWICLQVIWNPQEVTRQLTILGIVSLAVCVLAALAAVRLLPSGAPGSYDDPGLPPR